VPLPKLKITAPTARLTRRMLVVAGVSISLAACGSGGSSSSTAGQPPGGASTGSTGTAKSGGAKSGGAKSGGAKSGGANSTGKRTTAKKKAKPARAIGPRVGTTEQIKAQGTKLAVTVTKVLDPLKSSGAALLPGTRVVGVFVRIANRGPGGYDSSSTGDISIIPSSGVASPAYAPQGQCKTPLQDFDNAIGPGESREGCVAFTLNTAAKLVAERFSADGGGAGKGTWRGPK
jgi:hypothetical protein